MARDGLFFRSIAAVHPRFGTPARAIALQAALACALVALGTFNDIVAYFVFVVVVFIALTVAAVFVLRRRRASELPLRAPGYPAAPLLFLALVVLLLALVGGQNPRQAVLGVAVVALGLPAYYLVFRR
jgi:APA family basic amino acid/polyamine antiporter